MSARTDTPCAGPLLATAILLGSLVTTAAPASATDGAVLPPTAKPHGYSLTDMAGPVATFTFGGNDPALYPKTPFQILYVNGAGNSFVVKPGTTFYVPVVNIDNQGLTDFPTTLAGAQTYLTAQDKFHGTGFSITVDGVTTPLPPTYIGGPVTTPPLADGGTQDFTLGAFLHPLTPGTHTVTISGTLDGPAPYVGGTFHITHTYTVTVKPGG